jgi:hypothetical protein
MNAKEKAKQIEIINEVKLSVYNSIVEDAFQRTEDYDEMHPSDKMRVFTLVNKITNLENKIAS